IVFLLTASDRVRAAQNVHSRLGERHDLRRKPLQTFDARRNCLTPEVEDELVHADGRKRPDIFGDSDDKRRARLNCIRQLLSLIPHEKVPQKKAKLPDRIMDDVYDDLASFKGVQLVAGRW